MSTPTGGQPPEGPGEQPGPTGPQGAPQSRVATLLLPIALVVVALSVVGLFLISQAPVAGEGDCVSRGDDGSISTVGCGSADADFRVAGTVQDTRSFQAETACLAQFPDSIASYFEGTTGEPGTVLCLTGV